MMPEWLGRAVFYQIYPQSFYDSNGDGIGDIRGIIQKLDYIRDLGCNAVWLNPCFSSPFFDAGYDIRDYYTVDPRYGSNQDLRELFDAIHRRSMHIILDLVPGHTSIEHPWFLESMKFEKNDFSDRYIWTTGRKVMPKTGPAGVYDTNLRGFIIGFGGRGGCCAVNFYSTQPALNYGFYNIDDPTWQQSMDAQGPLATQEALKDIMRFWLSMGCDGFRVDMAGHLVKNDPTQEGNILLWNRFRAFLEEEYPQAALISEWGSPKHSIMAGFHMDFLLKSGRQHYWELFRSEHPYFSREGKGNISGFIKAFMDDYELTNHKGLICIPTGNHDISRITEQLDHDELKIAYAFILSMPGAPFIYYGDEIGMRNVPGLTPVEGAEERICCRTPMQWDHGLNAGFSSASPEKLYTKIDPDRNRPCVANQIDDECSLYRELKKLISLRAEYKALQAEAGVSFLNTWEDQYPLVYKRQSESEEILVCLNPGEKDIECKISEKLNGDKIYHCGKAAVLTDGHLRIPGASATFFLIRKG